VSTPPPTPPPNEFSPNAKEAWSSNRPSRNRALMIAGGDEVQPLTRELVEAEGAPASVKKGPVARPDQGARSNRRRFDDADF
jgi:hypothetical protein